MTDYAVLKIPANPTPQNCFEVLKPALADILRLTREAPLSKAQRAGLSTTVAVHFFGAAIADQRRALGDGRPTGAIARELMEIIVSGLERGDRPKLVETP